MEFIEKRFRGSIICRVLGYPISYGILKLLLEKEKLDLNTITKCVRRSKQALCSHMTKLRLTNLVRYEKKGRFTTYWIKYPEEVRKFLNACEQLVKRISSRLNQ